MAQSQVPERTIILVFQNQEVHKKNLLLFQTLLNFNSAERWSEVQKNIAQKLRLNSPFYLFPITDSNSEEKPIIKGEFLKLLKRRPRLGRFL